jgi:Bacterial mobilisation protein (MobC)
MNQSIPKKILGQSGDDGNLFLRTKRIYIQLSPEEKQAIALTAKVGGFNSVAQYVRQMALSIGAVDNPVTLKRHYLECEFQLSKLGNNLNQIARRANSQSQLDQEILSQLVSIEQDATLLLVEARKKVDAKQ